MITLACVTMNPQAQAARNSPALQTINKITEAALIWRGGQ
jgi:hypothetical protein